MLAGPVRPSAELSRVLALPRRDPADLRTHGARLSEELTPFFALPTGTQHLKPMQAVALDEAFRMRGLFGGLPVGQGKTLISFLLPTVFQAPRPLLIVPANLREKTLKEFGKLSRDWISPRPSYQIETYSKLDIVSGEDRLQNYRPSLIVCDEADELRNPDRTSTKRLKRYLQDNPSTIFCVLTGTFLRKSLHNFAHLLQWSLRENAPIPQRWVDLEEWANALDEKVDFSRRQRVGALLKLCDPTKDGSLAEELRAARSGFRRRLCESPGVLLPDESECERALTINTLQAPADPLLDAAFKRFREEWETPDGWPMSDALTIFKHGTELSCGFYYKWDPRPPVEWIAARKSWADFVREKISNSQRSGRPLDTMAQVAQAFPGSSELAAWRDIEKTFVPNTVSVWLTSSVFQVARDWAAQGTGILWVSHRTVGETLAQILGVTFYGQGGISAAGDSIESCNGQRSIVASVGSNKKGRNLQDRFHRNLVIAPPKSARDWEQMIGRTHRAGQERDVQFDVIISSAENFEALGAAWHEASFVRQTQGQTQKILRATINTQQPPAGPRWNK